MKNYKFKIVGKNHPICKGDGSKKSVYEAVKPNSTIGREIKRYWNLWKLAPCHKSILVYNKEKIVAFFRFYIYKDGSFYDGGTWVSKNHRGNGLALMMWDKALTKYKPKKVGVYAASTAGLYLVKKVKKSFKEIKFDISK